VTYTDWRNQVAKTLTEEKETAKPRTEAQEIASEIGREVGEAIAKATGKIGRPPRNEEYWKSLRKPLPDKAPPGYAIVADRHGRSPLMVECYMIMNPVRGKVCEAFPIEGRRRGTVAVGSLADKIKGGDMLVVQFTPYPPHRDDGKPHLLGAANYPPIDDFEIYEGTYFNRHVGLEALRKVKGHV